MAEPAIKKTCVRMSRITLFAIVLCFTCYTYGQKIATLEVTLPAPANGMEIPASTNLDAITFLPDSVLSLVEINGAGKQPVVFQVQPGMHRTLYWMVKPAGDNKKKYVFELWKEKAVPPANKVTASARDGALTIQSGQQSLLRYWCKTVYPPAGIDTAYKRSGFIHPLWSPHGQELTRIQAPDHYHHYGIWNPWTHVLFEKDTVDFWNLAQRTGTVRFVKFPSVISGPVFGGFETLHEHVALKKDGREKTAMHELQSIQVYKPAATADYYIADITIQLNAATESDVLLLEYRYGGLGWRTTGQWNKSNSEVLSSEGKTRTNADGSKARWCIVQGALDADYGGVVMMSYPANYNHPEPLRIWPENQNGRGDMFSNFSPTKDRNWLLQPGNNYVLKYRLLVFNGHFTKEKAESAWQYFAKPPLVTIKSFTQSR
jgi:hypothetical protein